MIYRTVVGRVNAIAVDGTGRAYAAGLGTNGQGGFVTRLKPDGTVDYSMNLAGAPAAIAVDSSGSAFVLGIASQGFTTTSGAYLNSGYFFLARLNVNGSGLTYSTYLPTTNAACCVAVDSADNAVVVLVQPEMERGRSPLVSIPPFGRRFSKHRGLPIRCGLLEEHRREASAPRSSSR